MEKLSDSRSSIKLKEKRSDERKAQEYWAHSKNFKGSHHKKLKIN